MITVYIADTALLTVSQDVFGRYEGLLDETRRLKVRQCRNPEDKKRSLLAGFLLQEGVKERLYGEAGRRMPPLPLRYICGENGKPRLKDYPEIFFSLSHSGSCVICALSDAEVGADVQRYAGRKDGIVRRFFNDGDRKEIERGVRQGTPYEEMFCRIWTVKEAYMKLTGEGMRLGMERIVLAFENGERGRAGEDAAFVCRRFAGEEKENYGIAVCSYGETADIILKRVRDWPADGKKGIVL